MAKKLTSEEKKEKAKKEVELLKEKYKVDERKIILDLPATGLEPTYYWLTDYMSNAKGYELEKSQEAMAASVASSFFSDLGAKKTRMEQTAKEVIGSINTVVKSILNLIYDLKEFDRRLEMFDDIHKGGEEKKIAAEVAIKSVWMDEVDVKRGPGSINQLTASAKMEFVTLRDAFLQAKSVKDVNKMDLNDRVKRIVSSRVEEYLKWREKYEKDLRQRRKIELSYLKAQVASLKEYSTWARPYLIAAQKLRNSENLKDPENVGFVEYFDTSTITVSVRGKRKLKIGKYYGAEYQVGRIRNIREPSDPVYKVIELKFTFSSRPIMVNQQQGASYRHYGRISIEMKGYVLTKSELEKIKDEENKEMLALAKSIDNMTKESLDAIADDLNKYLNEEEKKETIPLFKPIDDFIEGIVDFFKPFKHIIPKSSGNRLSRKDKWRIKILREEGKKQVKGDIYKMFKIYRKAHGYVTFRG